MIQIIYFTPGNMPRRPGNPFIASKYGRHPDFNLPIKELKVPAYLSGKQQPLNNKEAEKVFGLSAGGLDKIRTAIEVIRVGTALRGAVTGLLDNGSDSVVNRNHDKVPYLSQSSSTPLGRNEATYQKTFVHVGRKTSSIIKEIGKSAFVEKAKKSTTITSEDYQSHGKRGNLILESGFNEKGFSFLLEDTYFSVGDFMTLFNVKDRFEKELTDTDRGIRDIYGCVYKTYNQLKIKNLISPYTCHIRIHLIKIADIGSDVRSLIQEITHNSSQSSIENTGRLPKELQYSTPEIYNMQNRFSINFLTNLSCSLSLSSRFKERARIVKTWNTTLAPGSIWDFNLTTHYGRGIHLNTLWDLAQTDEDQKISLTTIKTEVENLLASENLEGAKKIGIKLIRERINNLRGTLEKNLIRKTNEHPAGFVLALEYVGDRRATVQRRVDQDLFSGYSPVKLQIEFETNITYLNEQSKNEELLVYKRFRQDKDFDEDSTFENVFCPDREIKFHVPLTNIGNKKPFTMLEDGSLFNTSDMPAVMKNLQETFSQFGLGNPSAEESGIDPNELSPEPAVEPAQAPSEGAEPPTLPTDTDL